MGMSSDIRKAMILAAGEGTRLRPLTLHTPKVLLPIGGIPLIEYTLTWLKSHAISDVAINLYHLGDQIKDFVGDGSHLGVKVVYSEEETLLGTAGGVKKMEHFFDGTFVVSYGDNLTDFDLSTMIELHREKKAIATLAVFEVSNPSRVGVVQMNGDGRLSRLVEKSQSPFPNSGSPILANGGVYVLEREVMDYIPTEGFSDFAYAIFPKLIELDLLVYGYVLKPEDYLLDIGSIEKYHEANADMQAGKVRIRHAR
jgi:NDP-sugar pyrophosphorylase family protein